jgi:arylsulfatase A-like enzyme
MNVLPKKMFWLAVGPVLALCIVENSKTLTAEDLLVSLEETASQPNVVVVMTDEHNFRTLGCYRKHLPKSIANVWGNSVVETPYIDSLAKQGAICTSYYATTPVCSPSRAALISGWYPHLTPVSTNNIPLDDDVITFAEILKRSGYSTGFAGKWHLDGNAKPGWAP